MGGPQPEVGQDLRDDLGCSMQAMSHIGPVHRGQMSGSTSETCVISRAQARFAADSGISLNYVPHYVDTKKRPGPSSFARTTTPLA